MGYNGDYLEGLVYQAKRTMSISKKYQSFNLSLLQVKDIASMKEVVEEAIKVVKRLNFYRYRSARKHSSNTISNKLDLFLAIDDVMYNDEANLLIGIDWTVNLKSIEEKVSKHSELQEAIGLVVDKTCVVCVLNENCLENIGEAKLAKAIYNLLKKINKEVSKYDFAGYLIIDAKELI